MINTRAYLFTPAIPGKRLFFILRKTLQRFRCRQTAVMVSRDLA